MSDSCSLTNTNNNVSFVTNHPQVFQPAAELSLIARSNMLRAPLRSLWTLIPSYMNHSLLPKLVINSPVKLLVLLVYDSFCSTYSTPHSLHFCFSLSLNSKNRRDSIERTTLLHNFLPFFVIPLTSKGGNAITEKLCTR